MNLETWLNEKRGRASELASHFNITLGAISQWRTSGVPLDRMKAVQAFTGGVVTLDEMVPGGPSKAPSDMAAHHGAPAVTDEHPDVSPSPGSPDDRRHDERRHDARRVTDAADEPISTAALAAAITANAPALANALAPAVAGAIGPAIVADAPALAAALKPALTPKKKTEG